MPLTTVTPSPSVATKLVAKQRAHIEARAASYAPGLKEQYDLQLASLESERGGDVEIICFPAFSALGDGSTCCYSI